MSESLLLPPVSGETAPFWEGTRRGELRVQRCRDTGRLIFPPRARSPWGRHRPPDWTVVSGRGRIWSFAVLHPPLLPPFSELAPYNVVIVALEEDETIRLIGNLVARENGAINEVPPDSIEIGAAVRVVFESTRDEIALPRWMLAESLP